MDKHTNEQFWNSYTLTHKEHWIYFNWRYASYNEFRHNIYRDALILSFTDTFTSLLAGFTVFSVMGYLAYSLGIDITEVSEGSSDMAFRAYPLVISKFGFLPQVCSFEGQFMWIAGIDWGNSEVYDFISTYQIFGILFFLMLLTLGAGSCFSDSGSIVTIIHDQFPNLKKWKITAGVCVLGFGTGLLYLTPVSILLYTLFNI